MSRPLVSVLVPIYNHAQYIGECLDSILELNYPNIEIVMCDDGSTDSSFSVAKLWLERNPRVNAKLLTQPNQGVCKTLNRLITESSGEYITLCASDDVLKMGGIEERLRLLQQSPDKYACIGDATIINEHSTQTAAAAMVSLYSASYENLKEDIVTELVLRWSVVGPTLLIKRSAYERFGMYDESLVVEDREFYLRLLSDNALIFAPISVAAYRVHQSNSSRKNIASRLNVLKQVALSNVKHTDNFKGICHYFLLSHKIDLYILNLSSSNTSYYLLQIFRMLRKFVFSPAIFINRVF